MKSSQAGFTLIEVLVASAIIMASIGVLMQLFGAGLDRTQRAGKQAHFLMAKRYIIHELEMLNPASQSQGAGKAEGLSFKWNASVMQPFHVVYDPEHANKREIALYAITVHIQSASNKEMSFIVDRIGWRDHP